MLNIPLNKQAGGIACLPSLVVEPRLDAARALAAVDDVGRQVGALVHPRRVRLRADVLHPAVTHLVLRQVGREQKVPQLVAETAEEGRCTRRLCLNSRKRRPPPGKISNFARRLTTEIACIRVYKSFNKPKAWCLFIIILMY